MLHRYTWCIAADNQEEFPDILVVVGIDGTVPRSGQQVRMTLTPLKFPGSSCQSPVALHQVQ